MQLPRMSKGRHFYICYKYGGGYGELMIREEFGAVTNTENGSYWEARPSL